VGEYVGMAQTAVRWGGSGGEGEGACGGWRFGGVVVWGLFSRLVLGGCNLGVETQMSEGGWWGDDGFPRGVGGGGGVQVWGWHRFVLGVCGLERGWKKMGGKSVVVAITLS